METKSPMGTPNWPDAGTSARSRPSLPRADTTFQREPIVVRKPASPPPSPKLYRTINARLCPQCRSHLYLRDEFVVCRHPDCPWPGVAQHMFLYLTWVMPSIKTEVPVDCDLGHRGTVARLWDGASFSLICAAPGKAPGGLCGWSAVVQARGNTGFIGNPEGANPRHYSKAMVSWCLENGPRTASRIAADTGLGIGVVRGVLQRSDQAKRPYIERSEEPVGLVPVGEAYLWSLTERGHAFARWAREVWQV